MKKYTVIVHYEGAMEFEVVAENEEAASKLAEDAFFESDACNPEILADWGVCDIWTEDE